MVWWLRAEQSATLRADLAELATRLGLPEGSGQDEQQAVDAAQVWLERNGRWLVIFDNAPDPDAVAELLVEGRGGHVLITSRTHADWGAIGARPVALDVWPRKEAVAFLRDRTSERDPETCDAVAEALGDLPLALEQAAAYANTQAIGLAGYLQRLRDRAPELFAAGRPVGYEHTVATVWQLAFEQIATQPVAQQLLEVCAFLGAERIPRELLQALADHSSIAGVSGQAVDEAIAALLGYALLTPALQDTLAMHRLIGQLTRERADTDTQGIAAGLAVVMLGGLWPGRPWEHEQWPACQRLLAHALTATEHTQRLKATPQHTANLLGRIAQYQQARGEYLPARQLTERALAINEAVYGPEHPEVASTLGNLGIVQGRLGEFEAARKSQTRALAIEEAVYGTEHPEVAATQSELAKTLRRIAGEESV